MVALKIKRERHVRLDELIKHVWDNDITDYQFESDNDSWVRIDEFGDVVDIYSVEETDLFTITEEDEITEDKKLNLTYRVKNQHVWVTFDKYETTINEIIKKHENLLSIHLFFIHILNEDGSIGELIWSKERGLID